MEITKKYWKRFFEILANLWRKFEETWGILCTIFLIFCWKFCDIFSSIFGKIYEKLLEKYEKYSMVSVFFKNAVITRCIVRALNISTLKTSWYFNFYSDAKTQRVRLYGHREKITGSKIITKIINDRVISWSLFKIAKIYHNYNTFLNSNSYFNLQLGFIRWRIHRLTVTSG